MATHADDEDTGPEISVSEKYDVSLVREHENPRNDDDGAMATFELDDGEVDVNKGKSSSLTATFNLANTALGAGVLAMGYSCQVLGLATFTLSLTLIALMSYYAIVLLTKSADTAGLWRATAREKFNYPALGEVAMGPWGRRLTALSVVLQQMGPSIIYMQILADVFLPIIGTKAEPGTFFCNRAMWQILFLVAAIFPLCMVRHMRSLMMISFSALALVGVFVVALVAYSFHVMLHPDLRMENYNIVVAAGADCGEKGRATDFTEPGSQVHWFRFESDFFRAFPILSFAFLCHMNVFPIYADLKHASVKRMSRVARWAMIICYLTYLLAGVFGYLTFLDSVKADILKNLPIRNSDVAPLMDVLRIGLGLAMILSYPVIIWEIREIVEEAIFQEHQDTTKRVFMMNCLILLPSVLLAILISDVEIMFGLVGSTCSPLIIFILPSVIYLRLHPHLPPEKLIPAAIMLSFGVVLLPACLYAWFTHDI